jgi:acyl carrier protein
LEPNRQLREANMATCSLKAIIADVLEIDAARLDENSGVNVTENWDSLNQYMIMSAVEREFDAHLGFSDMEDVATLRAIREFLQKQGIAVDD